MVNKIKCIFMSHYGHWCVDISFCQFSTAVLDVRIPRWNPRKANNEDTVSIPHLASLFYLFGCCFFYCTLWTEMVSHLLFQMVYCEQIAANGEGPQTVGEILVIFQSACAFYDPPVLLYTVALLCAVLYCCGNTTPSQFSHRFSPALTLTVACLNHIEQRGICLRKWSYWNIPEYRGVTF